VARSTPKRKVTSKRRTAATGSVRRIRRLRKTPKRAKAPTANPREGSTLDDFLRDEGLYKEATHAAIKETIAWQIGQAMQKLQLTKTEMAERMGTSRAALDRLLDPTNESVTLGTLLRAADALGVELHVSLRASTPA